MFQCRDVKLGGKFLCVSCVMRFLNATVRLMLKANHDSNGSQMFFYSLVEFYSWYDVRVNSLKLKKLKRLINFGKQ